MPEKVLLVDDEESILDSIEYVLGQEGFEVVRAKDGQEALQKVQLERPDIVVLDLMLPKMSGLDVCRTLRKEENITPIIILTAKGEEIDRVERKDTNWLNGGYSNYPVPAGFSWHRDNEHQPAIGVGEGVVE